MKAIVTEVQAVFALIAAGFIGVLARLLSKEEKMTFSQYIGRSVLNSFFALTAFAVYIYYPEADTKAIIAVGCGIAGMGGPTFELLLQRLAKK